MDLRPPVTFCSYQNIFQLTVFFSLAVFANQHVIRGSQRSFRIFSVLHFCHSFCNFSNFPGSHFDMLNCSRDGESPWSNLEVIPCISDPERMFSPDKCSSFSPKVYVNTEFESKNVPLRCIPRLTTHGQAEASSHLAAYQMENKGTGLRSFIPSYKCAVFMKLFPFFSGNKSAQFIIQLWQKASEASIWEFISTTKYRGCFKKKKKNCLCNKTLPHPWVFALPYVTMAHQSAPGCLQGLVQNPSEAVSSCSKWTDLAEDCLPWPEHSSPVSRIQIIDFSDATLEERARKKKKRKGWEKGKKKSLSEQRRRLPTWLECNSMSDLHISSVRHALSCHLFHLSLTWKCVCIPNGWRRGWATAPCDSEGSIRQVWLFLSPLSVWGAAAPVVRWVTQQSAMRWKCSSTAILWLAKLEKVAYFFRKFSQYSSNHIFILCVSVRLLYVHLILVQTREYIYCSAHGTWLNLAVQARCWSWFCIAPNSWTAYQPPNLFFSSLEWL